MPFLNKTFRTKHYNSNKIVRKKLMTGIATILTANVNLYEGYLKEDIKQGFGIYSKIKENHSFKLKYKGNWSDNKKNGYGKGYFKDGSYYIGQWKNGSRWGFGKMWYKDGSFYGGFWKCDKRDGQGLFVYVNGDRYEGSWQSNQKHGIGRLFHLIKGQMQEGSWFRDAAICTTIENISIRQTVMSPAAYRLKSIELQWPAEVILRQHLALFQNECEFEINFIENFVA